MPTLPAAVELLAAAAVVLSRWGRWYVFGAQAVIAHGVPRLSADVDITLEMVRDAPEQFARDMLTAGFDLLADDPDFLRRTRVMPFVHRATGMPLDVVLAGSGLEEEFLRRARSIDLGGTSVPVMEIGDLVIAKILAGRPKDMEDVKALWRIHGNELDRDRIREILSLLEEALSQSDLLRALESVIRSEDPT